MNLPKDGLERVLKPTSQYKKDLKKAKKRGKNLEDAKAVTLLLQQNKPLPKRYKDHALVGNWKPCRECHIEPDWLLIYDTSDPDYLVLIRTGSHADLFN